MFVVVANWCITGIVASEICLGGVTGVQEKAVHAKVNHRSVPWRREWRFI